MKVLWILYEKNFLFLFTFHRIFLPPSKSSALQLALAVLPKEDESRFLFFHFMCKKLNTYELVRMKLPTNDILTNINLIVFNCGDNVLRFSLIFSCFFASISNA